MNRQDDTDMSVMLNHYRSCGQSGQAGQAGHVGTGLMRRSRRSLYCTHVTRRDGQRPRE